MRAACLGTQTKRLDPMNLTLNQLIILQPTQGGYQTPKPGKVVRLTDKTAWVLSDLALHPVAYDRESGDARLLSDRSFPCYVVRERPANRITIQDGWIRLDGEGICLDTGSAQGVSADTMLAAHAKDQRAYIERMTQRCDKVERYLTLGL